MFNNTANGLESDFKIGAVMKSIGILFAFGLAGFQGYLVYGQIASITAPVLVILGFVFAVQFFVLSK